jgi:hypothetical protein
MPRGKTLRQINTPPIQSTDHRAHLPPSQGEDMSDRDEDSGPVPLMQQLLDNPFLLLFLGVLVPMVVYTLWGVIDILTIPLAK